MRWSARAGSLRATSQGFARTGRRSSAAWSRGRFRVAAALALRATRDPRERNGLRAPARSNAIPTGAILGPLVGGTLADLIGYRQIFFVTAAMTFIAGILVILLVPRDFPPKSEVGFSSVFDNYRTVFSSRQFRILFLVLFGSQFALMSIQPVMALYVESLGASGRLLATTTESSSR